MDGGTVNSNKSNGENECKNGIGDEMYNDGNDTTLTNLNNMAVEFTDLIDINLEVAKGDELIGIALTVNNISSKNDNNTSNANIRHDRSGNNKRRSYKQKSSNNTLKFDFDSDFDLSFKLNSNNQLANGCGKCDNTTSISNISNSTCYGFDTKYNGGGTI